MYLSGGYYLISPSARADYMDSSLLPETILTVSACMCQQHPTIDFLWGKSRKKKQNYALELNTSSEVLDEMENWVEENFRNQRFLFPQVFTTVQLAKEFQAKFLDHLDGLKVVGMGLPEQFVNDYLDEEETHLKPKEDQYGVEQCLMSRTEIDPQFNEMLGYEVLGFESGIFHTYLCNHLEKDFDDAFSFSLNNHGFIQNLEKAITYCDYSNNEEIETEEVLWLPWAIFNY